MAVHERQSLSEKTDVFEDRNDAGRILGALLGDLRLENPVVLAVPAGGVPVAVPVAKALDLPLDVAVVSKVTLPWNTEAGYGAVAFDGTSRLNHALVRQVGLSEAEVEEGIARTRRKVERRAARLREGGGAPDVRGRTAILVDDGLASGFTMRVAIEAVRAGGAARIVVATPTGHRRAVETLAAEADDVVCPNVRSGTPYAVADAYRKWADVPEVVAEELLRKHRASDHPKE